MSERPFPTPSSDDVITALERTGYLLEQRVARRVEAHGFFVNTGRAFKDPEEGKSREIDVAAYRRLFANEESNITLGVRLLIECKKSSGPYVVLGRKPSDNGNPPHAHTMPISSVRWEVERERNRISYRSMSLWQWLGLHELPHSPNRDGRKGLQLVRMHLKGKEWQADNSSIFDSLTLPLMKAVEAFRPPRDRASVVPSYAHMELCFPAVVTSGELFYVDADVEAPSAVPVDWVSIDRDVNMEGMSGNFSMDIVTYDALGYYLASRVLAFAEEVQAVISSNPGKLLTREVSPP
ncbi:hypothetical protein ABT202_03675 [Streptomyces sp900105245]|uniref:hypothetical protein n=1 Tax=Streptomyces sp. 900105245 TaxID=3154379 RepID=UPI00333453DD